MEVERDEVNIVTVRGVFMLDAQTGYIKLGDFSETSDKEVGDALEKLKAQGMKRLVFDLRDNPGGPLDQAIRIANRFLPRGDMIVYTRGRVPNADQDYRGTDDPDFTGPADGARRTATARAPRKSSAARCRITTARLVVGETTFGKALVQSVYKISEGAGLALTTGRYFTPSGRMIQRPWDNAFDEYLTYTLREQNEKREHAGGAAEIHRRRPQGLQRRRHRARQVLPRPRAGFQPDAVRPLAGRPRGVRQLRRALRRRRRHADERGHRGHEAPRPKASPSTTR